MRIDRHNCFGGSCAAAGDRMLAAISAWRDAVADMIPEVPRGIGASKKITDQQAWNVPVKAGGIRGKPS